MSQDDKKPAEFFSDEHRDSHIGALVHELEGYEAKAKGADARKDEGAKAAADQRADQVRAELKRLGADAKTGRQRATTR